MHKEQKPDAFCVDLATQLAQVRELRADLFATYPGLMVVTAKEDQPQVTEEISLLVACVTMAVVIANSAENYYRWGKQPWVAPGYYDSSIANAKVELSKYVLESARPHRGLAAAEQRYGSVWISKSSRTTVKIRQALLRLFDFLESQWPQDLDDYYAVDFKKYRSAHGKGKVVPVKRLGPSHPTTHEVTP